MNVLGAFVTGSLAVAAVAIIFVKAGNTLAGQSGGQQTAQIVDSLASGYSQVITALEGGK